MSTKSHNDSTGVEEFRYILLVKDLTSQKTFYEDVFNWPIIKDWGGGILYDTGAATLELIQEANAKRPNGSSRIAISVPDARSLYERLKNKVTILFPPRNNSWGDTSFRINDPEGFQITLFTPDKQPKH